MQLRACHYDEDSDIITAVYVDGTTSRFHCSEIEATLGYACSSAFSLPNWFSKTIEALCREYSIAREIMMRGD